MQKKSAPLCFGQLPAVQKLPGGFQRLVFLGIMYQHGIRGRYGKRFGFLKPVYRHIQTACPMFVYDLPVIDFIRQGFQFLKTSVVLPGFSAR